MNEEHGITWEDSVRWVDSARQREPLSAEQVVRVVPIGLKASLMPPG